jgi:heme A synthase
MILVRALSAITAAFAWLLVALSPIVRITGSGMGCGDHWPLCNGRLIPPLDNLAVMIEWGHRLAVVGLTALVVALLVTAWRFRRAPGVGGAGGVLRPTVAAAILLVLQSLLGAVTVWMELPPWVVVVHLMNAMVLLAVTLVAALRAFLGRGHSDGAGAAGALAACGLGATALLLGALTANLHAGTACTGFPLCSGRLWPAPGAHRLVYLHWMHRLVAYALALHLAGMTLSVWRRPASAAVRAATTATAVVLAVHVAIAAVMVLESLPLALRAAHAALGGLVWVGLVALAWTAAHPGRQTARRGRALAPDPAA